MLKNGCIVHDCEAGYDRSIIDILCDKEQAARLFQVATKLCSKAALVSRMERNSRIRATDKP